MGRLRPIVRRVTVPPSSRVPLDEPARVPFWRRCWEHHRIPDIAAEFPHVPPSPGKWAGHRFDVVWVLDSHGDRGAFSQTPENLLHDDNKPIKNKDD
jgi:hypothetical protein